MEPIYTKEFFISTNMTDCYGDLRPSQLLYLVQEMSGQHFSALDLDHQSLADRRLFWAVTRHRAQITRMPRFGETIRIETWPMPATKVAFPRSVVAYDEGGQEVFRSISLWVLMHLDSRSLILPGKSGIQVAGTVRGDELAVPTGILAKELLHLRDRTVCFTDLDCNGHMNNSRYFDWINDLFGSDFHSTHTLKEFTICYNSEAREGQTLHLSCDSPLGQCIQVEGTRDEGSDTHRVFSAKLLYDTL